jgi:2-polyprenyl-6-methoxyphenol hydroxylase-like FAD-dependent oxidoreductase
MSEIQTPILIVGGGPGGLISSIELSNRGIPHLLVNDRPEPARLPKLDIANTRTMEILRRIGVADAVRRAGSPPERSVRITFKMHQIDPPIAELGPGSTRMVPYESVADFDRMLPDHNDGTLPLETNQLISQMFLEPVLLSHARASSLADIRFGWRLLSLAEDGEGVDAEIQEIESERRVSLRCQYLVGCDGASGMVRPTLGVEMEGGADLGIMTSFFFRSAELAAIDPKGVPWHSWTMLPDESGPVVSVDGKDLFVVHALGEHEDPDATLRKWIGRPFEYELLNVGTWNQNLLVANRYASQRVFLTGDAAHQYIPTYGLGYNTASIDVTNLAWKLAAMVQGWGADGLLESYEEEQRPLALARAGIAGSGAQALGTWHGMIRPELREESPRGAAHRRELAEQIPRIHGPMYESLGVELGFRYSNSSVICPDGTPEPDYDPAHFTPTTWPGGRLPHVFLSDGTAIFDRLGRGFTLVVTQDGEATEIDRFSSAAATRKLPLDVLVVDEPWIQKLYERKFILVRPDQHVAWRADEVPANPLLVIDRVRGAAESSP